MPDDLDSRREQLLDRLRSYGRCVVALSAGVDSAVVAQAAFLALGENALAATGVSDSLAEGELDEARTLAAQIGIRHVVVSTAEFARPEYRRNAPDRCYHCKTELYEDLAPLATELGGAVIVNGVNVDDLGDFRPGLTAAAEYSVRSPLAECGFTKVDVRALALAWNLPVWDKPASPCLASRIAYGEEVTPERTAMVDRAEQYLRTLGLRAVRVRYHRGDLARIEAPPEALAELARLEVREPLLAELLRLGFKFVTLDLAGFRSGSLNTLVPIETLRDWRQA